MAEKSLGNQHGKKSEKAKRETIFNSFNLFYCMIATFSFSDLKVVFRDIGIVLQYSSMVFIVPLLASLAFMEEPEFAAHYFLAGAITFLLGTILKTVFATSLETRFKHALLIIALAWLVFTGLAAMPLAWIANMSFLHAYFEAMSALTTTGLSIMTSTAANVPLPLIDNAPASLILWRSLLSWIGGIGIVVMALVGIFSSYSKTSKLIIAEGREERLKPNLRNSVKEIWSIYAFLTIIGVILLFFSGMEPFEAVNYSMSAISTTGMTTTSQGLNTPNNYWANAGMRNYWVDISLVIIMVLGATSFYTHYLAKKGKYQYYWHDAEFRGVIVIGLIGGLMIIPKLGLESGLFHSFSALTCGGFELAPEAAINSWDDFVKLVLIIGMFIGGAAGSTAGGVKMSRFIIFVKSIYWKVRETLLPKGSFFPKKYEGRPLSNDEIREINLFILLYIVFLVMGILVLTFNGATIANATFEVVSAQGNAGISTGLTRVDMNPASELMLIVNMWVGRLEIIPVFSLVGFFLRFRAKRKRNE